MREEAERWLGRPITEERWQKACQRVERALTRVGSSGPLEFALQNGLTVERRPSPLSIGSTRFFGRLEGDRILIYPSELPCAQVVAHELFHWLDPGPDGEFAAHLFVSRWLGLSHFPGQ
ncbi:hypothetical protein DYH09_03195 [bacterium CPR1]|nr:hypothetical protein [bacterium CPR1]